MQEFTALVGAYVRSYADIKFEAESDTDALAAAIAKYKRDDTDIVFHETDWENVALPSICYIERLPGRETVIEGYDFALDETDARHLHAEKLFNIAQLIASGCTDIDTLKEMALAVLTDINAAYQPAPTPARSP
jgi:hypothetical protein